MSDVQSLLSATSSPPRSRRQRIAPRKFVLLNALQIAYGCVAVVMVLGSVAIALNRAFNGEDTLLPLLFVLGSILVSFPLLLFRELILLGLAIEENTRVTANRVRGD